MEIIGRTDNNSVIAQINGNLISIPDDPENTDRIEIAEWEAKGNMIPPYAEQLPKPTLNDYRAAVQSVIEETAQSKGYDSAVSIASYTASTNPIWSAQAQAFVAWRDAVWQYVYGEYEKFQLGTIEQPSVADFLTDLPIIDWD